MEHGLVEFSLYGADQATEDDFVFKVTVLEEVVDHHVEEEEKKLLPKVEKILGAERLEELGDAMEARFEELKGTDFRGPLHENLRQVLEGATVTAPAGAKKKGAKKAAPKKSSESDGKKSRREQRASR